MAELSDEFLSKKPQIVPIYKYQSIDRFKYLFWNAARKSVLEGKFADKLLPDLLPKLDGSQTIGTILEELDYRETDIIDTIIFLEKKGFLQKTPANDSQYSEAEYQPRRFF